MILAQHEHDKTVYMFWCPGCETPHVYYVYNDGWVFDGNMEKPSFRPSLLNTRPGRRCHLFVTNGQIIYLDDCHHQYAGKTIDMVKIDKTGWKVGYNNEDEQCGSA